MGESVTAEIVEAIAEAEGADPTKLDFTLQNHIDTDALRLLVEHKSDSWSITFDVNNHEVILSGDGLIQVGNSRSKINV